METTDLRHLGAKEKEAIRQRALNMHQKGVSQKKKISEYLGVHYNSVNNWVRKYKQKGRAGLKENPRGRKKGHGKLLSGLQEADIRRKITDKMPDQLKLPYALWTRKAIMELIEREHGVKLAIRTMGDYLKAWGFTPQKPKKRAYEQNPKAVGKWLHEQYPQIAQRAKQEKAEIHWGDETGIRNTSQYGRSYAPAGQTPVRTEMAKRLSLNMISSVTNQGQVRFMTYGGKMNAQRLISFLGRLVKSAEKKIFLILDKLKVHHSKLVKAWLEKHEDEIELFFLPSYCPEMNPDQYLNNDLKTSLGLKKAPRNEKQMKSNVRSHMVFLQKNPERVKRFFRHEAIKYAAA